MLKYAKVFSGFQYNSWLALRGVKFQGLVLLLGLPAFPNFSISLLPVYVEGQGVEKKWQQPNMDESDQASHRQTGVDKKWKISLQ